MAPDFVSELAHLSIGIAKVDIFFEPANFSVKKIIIFAVVWRIGATYL